MRRFVVIILLCLIALVIALATTWSVLALWYRLPVDETEKYIACGLFALIGVAAIIGSFTSERRWTWGAFIACFAALCFWWSTIKPPAEANWAADVARQVTGTIAGDTLTLTNVRAFEWRSELESTEIWATRSYDLSKLETLDLFLSYWGSPYMAHVMMSFGFEGGDYLTWSVEVKRTKDGVYSPLADLFKTDPLVIIVAEERDVIGVRSNFRGEDVQLYRLRAPPAVAKTLLLEYVSDANDLAKTPKFYNSLTANCATTVIKLMRAVGDKLPFDWQLIADGYLPGYAYDQGALDTRLPLAELIARSHIDDKAKAAGLTSEYSSAIRIGVPSPHDATPQ